VSFIAGPRSAIVRPLDNVPGYLVPAGQAAQPLTGILARGSLLLPGPRPGQEWDTASGSNSLVLVGADEQATKTRITLPKRGWPSQSAMSDGRGDILVASDSGSQYDAGPHWLRPVTALLSAVGPTRWLGMTCAFGHCRNVVLNPVTGSQRTLPGPPLHLLTWPWPAFPGAVAPDGLTAAIVADSGNGQVALEQISLVSGAVKPIAVPVNQNTSSQTMAWSPDSKWLFVLAGSGKLLAVNSRTGKVQSLGIPLPKFSQLTIRSSDA
jgi:DNA-binding beta-propeller fold protein YncE